MEIRWHYHFAQIILNPKIGNFRINPKLILNLNMMQLSLVICCLLPYFLFAQDLLTAKGQYELRIEKNWTEEYALKLCRENAILNALESVFGTSINQSNTLYNKNTTSGNLVKSDMIFYSVSNTLINGEWVKTIKESEPKFTELDGYRWVRIEIEGEVREIKKIPFSPEAHPLSCQNLSCSTEVFNNGQNFYLHFKSPKNGFVSIFLDDGENVQRLLPYSNQKNSDNFQVKADKNYVFFKKTNEVKNADEIELYTTHLMEQNRLFILFSTKEFQKPILDEDAKTDINGYKFPAKLESKKFQVWLQKLRIFNKQIELKTIDLTIRSN